MTALTAHRSTLSLLTSLQRAGWGDLSGREWQGVRSTLTGLVSQLPHGSGEGTTTVPQVAQAAGLSVRWVQRCMHVLEDLGVIRWHRGGVAAGKAQPSVVRVVKTALVALIEAARPVKEAADVARRAATAVRLSQLRLLYVRPRQRNRRSGHAHSVPASTPTGKGHGAPAPSTPQPPGQCDHGEPRGARYCALCRKGIAA